MKTPAPALAPADLDSWLRFFRARRGRSAALPWAEDPPLDPATRVLIARSIATFQLGESSDGAHLIAGARAFARREGAGPLEEVTRLFIAEEQFHASLLAAFMDRNGIPRLQAAWSDRVFRSLRRLGGFEATVSVLVVAELIALAYYQALARATPSKVLRRICELIIADELSHVAYEGALLRQLRRRRSRLARLAIETAHRALYAGALVVVFAGHRGVLAAGGYRFQRFWRECWASFRLLSGTPSSMMCKVLQIK